MPPEPDDLDEEILDEEDLVEEPEDEEDESPETEEEEPLAAEDEDEEPPAPAPRAQRKSFAQRVDERAERFVTERMRDLETKLTRQAQPQETQAQRNARLAEMDPWDRSAYEMNERLGRLEYEGQERLDKIDFAGLLRDRPGMAKFSDEVERRLSGMRANGYNASREVILKQILGERAWDNAGRATGRAARTAATNRERQTTRPGAARSDTVSTDTRRGDSPTARARRLENQSI